ncbi:MAG: signal transduction protein [Alphaproteobacteria bacterium]|nr:signal transduction protein [Alphaproteobacteria bacterium]
MDKRLAAGAAALLALGVGVGIAAAPDRDLRGDVNGDGAVTLAEMQQSAAQRFQKLDVNHDGKVTQAERDARRAEFAGKRGGHREHGADGVGEHRGRGGHGGHDGPHRGERFAALDANHDGVVTLAEFTAPAAERMQRIDANRDGKVTLAEFAAHRAAAKAERQQAKQQDQQAN